MVNDAVRDLLKERKTPEHVVQGGIEGLASAWEATVKAAQKGYTRGLDEWRNEVDARQLLSVVIDVAHPMQRKSTKLRLDAADAKFWKACESFDACVWGAANAEKEKWSATKEWWYFLVPKKAGDELAADLAKISGGKKPAAAKAAAKAKADPAPTKKSATKPAATPSAKKTAKK